MNHFRNRRRIKPIMYPLMIIGGAAFVLLFGWIVMLLWNAILPDLVNVNQINFWQALGLLVLCKILFGGFRGKSGGWGNRKSFGPGLKDNWSNMTPEERLKFKEQLRRRCYPTRDEPPTEELPKEMD
jgi:hypothetical protein